MLDYKKQVALHQAHRHCINDGTQDAQAGCLCNCFLAVALLLLGFHGSIGGGRLLSRMMHGAIRIRADAAEFAFFAAFGDDSLGGELASFILRPITVLGVGWFFVANLDILVARDNGAICLCRSIGGTDLNQFWLRCNGLLDVRFQLG